MVYRIVCNLEVNGMVSCQKLKRSRASNIHHEALLRQGTVTQELFRTFAFMGHLKQEGYASHDFFNCRWRPPSIDPLSWRFPFICLG